MPGALPTIYLIGGCNGAGKTTFAREFLPKEVNCIRFMNADEIARGLSPFAPNVAAIKAGRVLLSEVKEAIEQRHTFGWDPLCRPCSGGVPPTGAGGRVCGRDSLPVCSLGRDLP